MKTRTAEREEFLSNLLIGAIEHHGYGFPGVLEYRWEGRKPAEVYAVIYDRYEVDEDSDAKPEPTWRVDIDTMAKGLGIIRKKYAGEGYADWVKDLQRADRTNGDDGDYDVIGALAVLECALFGEITYG
jgi:hypothetical protein